jgi:hypothetical protein
VSAMRNRTSPLAVLAFLVLVMFTRLAAGQNPVERSFPQSRATIEKTLKGLQSAMGGRLPLLEGFTAPDKRPLDRFQRAYYQCTAEVRPTAAGGSLVRISAKISAWYSDPSGAKSGYQVLGSNGRLESDLLDQLSDALGSAAPASGANSQALRAKEEQSKEAASKTQPGDVAAPGSLVSAPVPQIPQGGLAASAAAPPKEEQNQSPSLRAETEAAERHERELGAEARNLEEILNNQAHPNNLVAVKKTGTAVVASPSADGKLLFAATLGDEFEILDEAPQWVHVRISGLSRGWIRRSSLQMPGDAAGESKIAEGGKADGGAAFHVGSEQFGAFPGDWAPLQGKTVKIISVQKASENGPNSGPRKKMEFTKALLAAEYDKVSSTAEGIVVIFDSEDGGMIAATVPALGQWKTGALSDDAFWHQCFFDPPEILNSTPAASQ